MDAALERALASFAEVHARDPAGEAADYHASVAAWVSRLAPEASLPLRLAASCQHLGRYARPRSDFPAGLAGYKRWRAAAALAHARDARAILTAAGFDEAVGERVGELLVKRGMKSDPEVQTLEDAACLTFLERGLAPFSERHPPDKVVAILQKTWGKMTPRGRSFAVELAGSLPPHLAALVSRAVPGAEAG